MEVFWFRN